MLQNIISCMLSLLHIVFFHFGLVVYALNIDCLGTVSPRLIQKPHLVVQLKYYYHFARICICNSYVANATTM